MEIHNCGNCLYGTNAKQLNGNTYVLCKNPFDYKGAKKSEIGLKCWTKK